MFAKRTLRSHLSLGTQSQNRVSTQVPNSNAIGIEVEVELTTGDIYPLDLRPPRGWRATEDGSLRNGVEYILHPPQEDYATKLDALNEFLSEEPFRITERCSVHVHLNILDMTEEEILNFVLLYTAFERVLNRVAGDRDSNTYCVSIYQAVNDYKDLIINMKYDLVGSTNPFSALRSPSGSDRRRSSRRYACLSLVRAMEIGTVEVRTHEGTLDMSKISRWVDYLMCLKAAAQDISPEFLLESLNEDVEEIFTQVFADKLDNLKADYLRELIATEENIASMYDSYRKGFYCAASLYHSPELTQQYVARLGDQN